MLYYTKRLLFYNLTFAESKKMSVFDKYCLLRFDINILETANGTVNYFKLGAPANFFGTIINGRARFVSKGVDFEIKEKETAFIPKGCVYRSEWYGCTKPKFYSLAFVMASDRENDARFSLQKVCCEDLSDRMKKISDGKSDAYLSSLAEFYRLYEFVMPNLIYENNQSFTASVMPAIRYIEENPALHFDVPYLADLCGISESSFYALFKKQTDFTPVDYKNKMRCIRASELLKNTDYTVEYISEKLGFCSTMYMRKVLRKFTGKTPGMIRREKSYIM